MSKVTFSILIAVLLPACVNRSPNVVLDKAKIRNAMIAGKPIVVARIHYGRPIAVGKKSQQILYGIETKAILSGQRNSNCSYVAHYTDGLNTHCWEKGHSYLFVFETPDDNVPYYVTPFKDSGNCRDELMRLLKQ